MTRRPLESSSSPTDQNGALGLRFSSELKPELTFFTQKIRPHGHIAHNVTNLFRDYPLTIPFVLDILDVLDIDVLDIRHLLIRYLQFYEGL